MSDTPASESERPASAGLWARAGLGGVLMGLANLVPGISGGTMLLAAGVYPAFISAIAELSRLRLRARPLATVAVIAGSALLAILLLAGPVKTLVVEQRWIMYSLFIGLTLGGVPLVWRLGRPATPRLWLGAALGFALMVLMAFGGRAATGGGQADLGLLFLSGVAGASAMILPGVSGGYLLLLLGQYEAILGAIDRVKIGLLGDAASGAGRDLTLVADALWVVVPVGLGVAIGVVGVSNLLRWLLLRHPSLTYGALLGLLLGAVVGLWPFQRGVEPEPGDVVRGRVLDAAAIAKLDAEDWPLEFFRPAPTEVAGALAWLVFGLAATTAVDLLGRRLERERVSESA